MNNFKNSYYYDIILLLIIYTIYFFFLLGSHHLIIPDEGRYPEIAREMLNSGNWITPTINGVPFLDKPPLYYWLEAISMYLFGINTWAIRIPQAIFGIVGCIAVYVFGRYFYSRFNGILASFILASNVLYFFEARYANMDLIVANLLYISFFLYLVSLKQNCTKIKRLTIYISYFLLALAFLTKGLIAFIFPFITIFSWIILTNNFNKIKELYIPSGIILLITIIAPWIILVQKQNFNFFYFFFYFQQFYRFFSYKFNNVIGIWFYFVAIFILFLPFSALFITRLLNGLKIIWLNRKQDFITFLLILWCVIILIFFSIPRSKIISYILPIFGPMSMLIALLLERLINNNFIDKQIYIITSIVFIILIFSIIVFSLVENFIFKIKIPIIYISIILVILLILIVSFQISFKNKIKKFIISIIISFMLINIFIQILIPYFNLKTSEYLVSKVMCYLNSNTIFIYYNEPQLKCSVLTKSDKQNNYQYDLPLLLNKNIYIVYNWKSYKPKVDNWAREFYYGIFQYRKIKNNKWPKYLITYYKFNQLIKNNYNTKIIIFTSIKQFKKLKKIYPNIKFKIYGKYNENIVIAKL